MGHYSKHDEGLLLRLFNSMTYHEKMDILSLDFSVIWYRIYRTIGFHNKPYIKKKTKFEVSFLQDNGKRLKKIIAASSNVDTTWELPKGRKKDADENDIDTACREFEEETRIKKYDIDLHKKPYIESYIDFDVTYQNCYYFAKCLEQNPSIKFGNNQQISEVADIRWCSITDLSYLNLEKNTYNRLTNMFRKIKIRAKKRLT